MTDRIVLIASQAYDVYHSESLSNLNSSKATNTVSRYDDNIWLISRESQRVWLAVLRRDLNMQ